jgi:DNA repair exonuclease SbcCD ATPase subunit
MATSSAAPRDPIEELLSEVRSLRAEIRHASDTSIRAQLLVGRLQLQEQRINTLVRQLGEADRQLSDNERARGAMSGPMAMFAEAQNQPSTTEREEFDQVFKPLKVQLEQMEKADRDIQAQRTYLTGLIAEEQARWATFNALLDELGKTVEGRPAR